MTTCLGKDEIARRVEDVLRFSSVSLLYTQEIEGVRTMSAEAVLNEGVACVSAYIASKFPDMNATIRVKPFPAVNSGSILCLGNENRRFLRIRYSNANDTLEQCVIITHELGNIVCHWEPARTGNFHETEAERKEATYFARLLLEQMMISCGIDNAREKVVGAIQAIHKGESWLDEVLSDQA